jgi:putative transposase
LIIPISTAGCGNSHRSWRPHSRKSGSVRSVRAGEQTKPTSRSGGQWRYLYRAIDRSGQTIDFLLTACRDKQADLRFFRKAIHQHGLPDQVTIDKSGANTAAIEALQEGTGYKIEVRQNKYLNNLIEQDHRAIKRIIRPMLGFKSFRSASITLQGIELMHIIKKGQMVSGDS